MPVLSSLSAIAAICWPLPIHRRDFLSYCGTRQSRQLQRRPTPRQLLRSKRSPSKLLSRAMWRPIDGTASAASGHQ